MDVARGGHIEPDDDPVQAVLREIEEETGLLAEIIPIHQSVSFTYPEQLPARLYNHRSSAETSGRQRRRGDSHRTTSPSAPAHHNVGPDSPAGFADTTRITMLTGPRRAAQSVQPTDPPRRWLNHTSRLFAHAGRCVGL